MLNAKTYSMAAALAMAILFAAAAEAQFPLQKIGPTISTAGTSYGSWNPAGSANYHRSLNNGGFVKSLGVDDAKLTFALYGTGDGVAKELHSGMRSPYRKVVADVHAPINAELFGDVYSVFNLRATGCLERGKTKYNVATRKYDYYDSWLNRYTYVDISVGPFTLYEKFSSGGQSYNKTHIKEIERGQDQTMAGPVPVTLQWSVMGVFGYGCGVLANQSAFEAKVYGYAFGMVTMSYYGGIGVPGASVGVQASCTLLETRIMPSIYANTKAGGGKIDVELDPVKLYLDVAIQYLIRTDYYTIWEYKSPTYSWKFPLF